jgi:hypothetical protein
MGILYNGSNWDYQNIDLITTFSASGTVVASGLSNPVNVVNGLNIGSPSISGTQPASGIVTFLVPAGWSDQTKTFTVVNDGVAGTSVVVSGSAGVTLNGGTGEVAITKLTGKDFYAAGNNAWVSF